MAVRRETIRKQFVEALQPLLEPGEKPLAGAWARAGRARGSKRLFGYIGMLLPGSGTTSCGSPTAG